MKQEHSRESPTVSAASGAAASTHGSQATRVVLVSAARGVWGAELSMLALASGLREIGCDVELVCFEGELEERWELQFGPPLAVVKRPVKQGRLSDAIALWRMALKKTRRNDVVILFTYYLVVLVPLLAPLLRTRRVRAVLDMHDNLENPRARALLSFCSRRCAAVVSISRFTAAQFVGMRRPVGVLNRPIEQGTRPPFASDRDRSQVGVIGRLVKEKQHRLVVEAVKLLPERFVLHVIGAQDPARPTEGQEILEHVRRELGDRVVLHGQLAPEAAFASVGTLIVANADEPMGRTALEAQFGGVIAVVPNAGGASELVEDELTGFKFVAGDAQSLADAIVRAADWDSALDVIRAARQQVETASDPANYAARYLALIEGDA